jgi:DNA-binding IclR family transcriptional regulator
MASGNQGVLGSATKCLALLDTLAGALEPLTLSQVAKEAEGLRGTVHKQLRTLIAAGWVEQTDDGRYRLSLHAIEVASAVLEQADLGSRVLPSLTSLAAVTGETSAISVLHQGSALILQRVATDRDLKVDIKVGTRMPLATSASGRVLVAFAPASELVHAVPPGVELPEPEILEAVRGDGYACSVDEYLAGMASVAVPLSATRLGTVALAITTPSARFEFDTLLEQLRRAEADISSHISREVKRA